MLKNYVKVALRSLRRDRVGTVVILGGLAVGIACCLLLFLFVEHEWSYDRFHADSDRLFRVVPTYTSVKGETSRTATSPPLLGPTLAAVFPAVESVTRVGRRTLRVETDRLKEEEQAVEFVDPSLFQAFTFELDRGDPRTALRDPGTALLSQEAALKYFGGIDPIGHTLTVTISDSAHVFLVTGVLATVPSESSLSFSVVLPFDHLAETYAPMFRLDFVSWPSSTPIVSTFVLLTPGATLSGKELSSFVYHQYGPAYGLTALELQPLRAIHHDPTVRGGLEPVTDPRHAYLLSVLALLILVIACINFVTMMLSRSVERAREVGVRKAVGASRRQVLRQFWGESVLVVGFALGLGLVLAAASLPAFNVLLGRSLSLGVMAQPSSWLAVGLFVLSVGLAAGVYPALVLSAFSPQAALTGRVGLGQRWWVTRALVTFQFTVAIALVCGAFAAERQLGYLLSKDLGFTPERVILVYTGDAFARYRNDVSRYGVVEEVAGAAFTFGSEGMDVEVEAGGEIISAQINFVDAGFLKAMGIVLGSGHDLREGAPSSGVLVNEAFVEALGWDDPVGRTIPFDEETVLSNVVQGMRIVGVTEDYHFEPLHKAIKPQILAPPTLGLSTTAVVRIRPDVDHAEVLALLRAAWGRLGLDKPFQYEFLSDTVAEGYAAERRWRSLAACSAFLVLLIAATGMFSLSALMVSQRTKEIGIRRVLGATVPNLVVLLSQELLVLVVLASILGAPLAYLGLQWWLAGFAYHVATGPSIFVTAILVAALIAMAAVGTHTIRAATADPARSLRYE